MEVILHHAHRFWGLGWDIFRMGRGNYFRNFAYRVCPPTSLFQAPLYPNGSHPSVNLVISQYLAISRWSVSTGYVIYWSLIRYKLFPTLCKNQDRSGVSFTCHVCPDRGHEESEVWPEPGGTRQSSLRIPIRYKVINRRRQFIPRTRSVMWTVSTRGVQSYL